MNRRLIALVFSLWLPLSVAQEAPGPRVPNAPAPAPAPERNTYSEKTILAAAEEFFGEGAEGMGKIVARLFREMGRPTGYIKGEEAGGAVGVGLRYGDGTLVLHNGVRRKVHWQGPSIGFDLGANAAKVFMLTYRLHDDQALFRRYPGVEGSLYFVAGVGVNYLRRSGITLAPIRLGVGWRQGAAVGYVRFTPTRTWVPF